MNIKLIGLGKMGANIALNLMDHGHTVLGYARTTETRSAAEAQGIKTVDSLEKLFANTEKERTIAWLLIPDKSVDETIQNILPFLKANDIIIDGGNSNYLTSLKRYQELQQKNIEFVDLGTSGGTNGARNGACLMVGGNKDTYHYLEAVLKDISKENGCDYMGSPGAGHFVKMVHNGIEYGMMQAIGEGFDLLEASPFALDYEKIARVWNHGSIIESSLIQNVLDAFSKDAKLEEIEGKVDDSGEGKWMIENALNLKVSTPIIANALFARFKSKDETKFSEKVVAAMRNEFGGHKVYKK